MSTDAKIIEKMQVGQVILFGYCGRCCMPFPWAELSGNYPPYGARLCERCRAKLLREPDETANDLSGRHF